MSAVRCQMSNVLFLDKWTHGHQDIRTHATRRHTAGYRRQKLRRTSLDMTRPSCANIFSCNFVSARILFIWWPRWTCCSRSSCSSGAGGKYYFKSYRTNLTQGITMNFELKNSLRMQLCYTLPVPTVLHPYVAKNIIKNALVKYNRKWQ